MTCQRKAASGGSPPQKFFHLHFLQSDHNGLEEDAVLQIIDKTDPTCPRKREKYWIDRLETMYPKGLNTETDV